MMLIIHHLDIRETLKCPQDNNGLVTNLDIINVILGYLATYIDIIKVIID